MSAAIAEPEIIASAVANKTIFFMEIPIAFTSPVRFRRPQGQRYAAGIPKSACNLDCAEFRVKQKCQAFADFLGVWSIPRQVVAVCCFPTTILTQPAPMRGTGPVFQRGHGRAANHSCESPAASRL